MVWPASRRAAYARSNNALVLSVDEETQIQALDRPPPLLPLRPGQVERRTHDYKQHGTTNLYAAFKCRNQGGARTHHPAPSRHGVPAVPLADRSGL